MRDEQVGQPVLFLEILEQIDHLRLDRDVKCGDWLIANDEVRLNSKGTRNPDALALSA